MRLLTVAQLAQELEGVTEAAIRWDIFNAKKNGLEKSGAIVRRGRRILLFPERYVGWMEARTKGQAA